MKSLKEVYKPYFKIGAAITRRDITTHADLLKTHFNSLTCGNEMKYVSLYDRDGNPKTDAADDIHRFAIENNMGIRGHTLVWHNQTPQYIFMEKDRNLLISRLAEHMRFVSARYDRNIYAWDVVNEAIDDKGDEYLRKTQWLEILGEDYLVEVFRLAGEIFPGKALYYNDYNDADSVKRVKIARLVKQLQDSGVPIHGVGMQAHYNIYTPDIDDIKEAIELYASLGVEISITEMDVSVFRFEDHSSLPAPTPQLIEKQAEYYRRCFNLYREYSKHIDSVTLWGPADDATWLDNFPVRGRKNWPLLFDEEHKPKEAFWRIIEF